MLEQLDTSAIVNSIVAGLILAVILAVGGKARRHLDLVRKMKNASSRFSRRTMQRVYLDAFRFGGTSRLAYLLVTFFSIAFFIYLGAMIAIPLANISVRHQEVGALLARAEAADEEIAEHPKEFSKEYNGTQAKMIERRQSLANGWWRVLSVGIILTLLSALFLIFRLLPYYFAIRVSDTLQTYSQCLAAIATKEESRELFRLRLAARDLDSIDAFLTRLSELAVKYEFPADVLIQPLRGNPRIPPRM